MSPCRSRNHIPPAGAPYRSAPRVLDRSALRQERAARNCAARSAGSDPPKTCGLAAQWAFLRHTHRAGSLPANWSFQEGGRRRRRGRMRAPCRTLTATVARGAAGSPPWPPPPIPGAFERRLPVLSPPVLAAESADRRYALTSRRTRPRRGPSRPLRFCFRRFPPGVGGNGNGNKCGNARPATSTEQLDEDADGDANDKYRVTLRETIPARIACLDGWGFGAERPPGE